jgi:quinol monooxygenase YgiN
MIHHVVIWKLKPEALVEGRPRALAEMLAQAAAMRAGVPGLLRLELGANEMPGPDAGDLVLYTEFNNWEALRVYEAHPLHQRFRALVGPLRSERRSVDYESQSLA